MLSSISKNKKETFASNFKKNYDIYFMLFIALAFLLVFKYIPMLGNIMAFQDFDIFYGFFESPYVGFKHFEEIFSSDQFYSVLTNTLLISIYKIIFFFPVPIILAILLNEVTSKVFKRTSQTIIYIPHFLSWVVVAGIVFDILSSNGAINSILINLGFDRINFLMEPDYFRSIVVVSAIWKEAGYSSIVFLAALTSIDPTLYEAASIDGASKIKQIRHITLPGISSMIVIMLLLRVGTIMDANVEQIMALYNPTVYETGDVLGTYTYRTGLGSMEYSYATAVGMFNSVVSFSLVVLGNFLSKKFSSRSLW